MNYWDVLAAASARLEADDLIAAERLHDEALRLRERSPGRVFISERIADAGRRVWSAVRRRPTAPATAHGRWRELETAFRCEFQDRGEAVVRRALRLSDFPSAEPATTILPGLITALHLLTTSRLFTLDAAGAARILKVTISTAARAGQPVDPALLRHDLPLTEEDRVWLGRKADAWLEALALEATGAGGGPLPGGAGEERVTGTARTRVGECPSDRRMRAETSALAAAIVRVLDAGYFSPTSRQLDERAWLVAHLTDRYLASPAEAVRLYRAYLAAFANCGQRAEFARVRLLELLANIDSFHFPVPRYDEALAFVEAGRPSQPEAATRYDSALKAIALRAVQNDEGLIWGSLWLHERGVVLVVWRNERPCDLATWQPGEPAEDLLRFAARCAGRLVCQERAAWIERPELGRELSGPPARAFVEALWEPQLGTDGLDEISMTRIALTQLGPWQRGWDRRWGHPLLAPPIRPGRGGALAHPLIGPALEAGLVWRACLERLATADPALAAGVQVLAQQGDPGCRALAQFLDTGSSPGGVVGDALAGLLGDLGSRSAPLPPNAPTAVTAAPADPPWASQPVAIVTAAQPGPALAAWGAALPRLRIVLDEPGRLVELGEVPAAGDSRVTLVPPGGRLHALRDALAWFASGVPAAIAARQAGTLDLLPLYHWIRIVETHNGDLRDHEAVRRRSSHVLALDARHAELASNLPRVVPSREDPAADPWALQYAVRARASRIVAGGFGELMRDESTIDVVWGVEEGGDAAWVFLDSAAIHWRLWRAADLSARELHARLSRRGSRHLSLVLGGRFLRDDLAAILRDWLAPYGDASLHDGGRSRDTQMRFAAGGVAPDAHVLLHESLRGLAAHVERLIQNGERAVVLVPSNGRPGAIWRDLRGNGVLWPGDGPAPELLSEDAFWSGGAPTLVIDGACLVVPALSALDEPGVVHERLDRESGDMVAQWQSADAERAARAVRERSLCALEVAALSASGAAALDIADPRWWRRFAFRAVDTSGKSTTAWAMADDASAAAAFAPAGAIVYDLPFGGPALVGRVRRSPRGAESADSTARLRAALRGGGWLDEDGDGPVPGLAQRPVERRGDYAAAPQGIRLLCASDDSDWAAALRSVAEAREQGVSRAWVLAVGGAPPPGAFDFVREYGTAAPSVYAGDRLDTAAPRPEERITAPWGPLLWVTPAALADPGLQERLADNPPLGAFVSELHGWLPSADCPMIRAAAALRFLTDRRLPRVEISAPGLSRAWRSFLLDAWAHAECAGRGGGGGQRRGRERRERSHGGTYVADPATDDPPLTAAPIAVGRMGSLSVVCVSCGARFALPELFASCPTCGLAAGRWLSTAARVALERELLRLRVAGLAGRDGFGGEREIIRVWVRERDLHTLAACHAEFGLTLKQGRAATQSLRLSPRENAEWEVLPAPGGAVARPAAHEALFWPPRTAEELTAHAATGGSLSLWYHPVELNEVALPAPGQRALRCGRLLEALAAAGRSERDGSWVATLPEELVHPVCGLPAGEVKTWLALARWLAVYAGPAQVRRSVPAARGSLHLVTQRRFVEIELHLRRLGEALESLLSPVLQGMVAGAFGDHDLSELAADLPTDEIAAVDRLLVTCSLRLRDQGQDSVPGELFPPARGDELVWLPIDGLLISDKRRIGYLGDPERVLARLRERLAQLRAAARQLFGLAEFEEGTLRLPWPESVEVTVARDLLAVGLLQGWWRREGAAPSDFVDLSVACGLSLPAPLQEQAVALYSALVEERLRWEQILRSGWATGLVTPQQPCDAQSGETPQRECALIQTPESSRVEALLAAPGRGVLVLRGLAGTGKLEAVLGGVGAALRKGLSRDELVFYCPNVATAVRVHLQWRRLVDPYVPPPLRLVDAAPRAVSRRKRGSAADDGRTAILTDAWAIPQEERHRLCLRHRQSRLIVIHDPAATGETMEHLLLDTPPTGAVLECTEQRWQSRRVWEETRAIAAQILDQRPRGKTERRERGLCQARYAENLDECLGLLFIEQAEGRLGSRVGLVAAVQEDLTYIGRSLGARGWIPVFRWELDALLMPGPLEFLAAISDAASDEKSLLAGLLGPHERLLYGHWRDSRGCARSATVSSFYDHVVRTHWATAFLAEAASRRRVEQLVMDAGGETLERFVRRPLWKAWRQEIAAGLGLPPLAACGPVVALSTPDTIGATGADLWLYLCLGSEPPISHYRVFSRAADRLLVLYQECSPLPGEAAAEG